MKLSDVYDSPPPGIVMVPVETDAVILSPFSDKRLAVMLILPFVALILNLWVIDVLPTLLNVLVPTLIDPVDIEIVYVVEPIHLIFVIVIE